MLSFDALIFHAILCDSCWLETIRKQSSLYFSSIKLSKSCSVISVLLGDSVGYVELLQEIASHEVKTVNSREAF